MSRVHKVNGEWFAYGKTRVLGPFRFAKQAHQALEQENED